MGKITETIDIKLEFLKKDKEKVWNALFEIEKLAENKQDIPFSLYKKVVKPLIVSELYRDQQKEIQIKRQKEKSIKALSHFKFSGTTIKPDMFEENQNYKTKYNIEILVGFVFERLEKLTPSPKANYKAFVSEAIVRYVHFHNIKKKVLPDYQLTRICGEILESIGIQIIPKTALTKRTELFDGKLSYDIKKARKKIGIKPSPSMLF